MVLLAIFEQMGLTRQWIGFVFLFATVALYAGIGIMSRTSDAAEYYVAGRRVPAVYNGMATGADWMSAASFIGMAGTLYLTGYGGLAFILGWTGGYCLVALFLAPYLRKFGQFTIPDFLGARYEGNAPRFIGILAAILCSFTYVVAQIYGVGLITTRLSGLAFEVGIFVGLGGILVCSFLGGMRAVTWQEQVRGPGADLVALDLERVRPREVVLRPEPPAGDPLVRAERRVGGLDRGVDRCRSLRRRGLDRRRRAGRPAPRGPAPGRPPRSARARSRATTESRMPGDPQRVLDVLRDTR